MMRINFKFEAPILQVQMITYIIYYYLVRWHHVESDILKEGPGTETSWEVGDCRTPNT